MTKMPLPPPGRRGSRCSSRLKGGEQGIPERPNPLRRRSSLRYSERLQKNRSIRGFRFLSYTCICAKFFFPTGIFSFFCTAWYMCIYSYVQFYWVLAESVVPLLSLLSLWCPESLAVLPNEAEMSIDDLDRKVCVWESTCFVPNDGRWGQRCAYQSLRSHVPALWAS